MPPDRRSDDFAALQRPLRPSSPRAWRFAALSAATRAGALVSDGLRIGYRHGFDSGPFMAHVYADRPSGRTAVGRTIDRRLLRRRTCVAFRDVRALAEQAVVDALDACPAVRPVVADLAAGPAPYLLAALARRPRARAIAGDVDATALAELHAAAVRLGVAGRLRLVRADAFDRSALAALGALAPPPDVVVELGLYGIYHDDVLVERHFADLATLVGPRQLVFNVQTRNPEIEHIARVWRNADGARCVWRLRPVERLLGYAEAAGYRPAATVADRFGIYRVVRLERRR